MSSVTAPEHLLKQPTERRRMTFDLSALLDGTTISGTPTITSTTLGGEASDLVINTISVDGDNVVFFAESGTHAVRYRLEVTVNTYDDQRLVGDGILRVTDI